MGLIPVGDQQIVSYDLVYRQKVFKKNFQDDYVKAVELLAWCLD